MQNTSNQKKKNKSWLVPVVVFVLIGTFVAMGWALNPKGDQIHVPLTAEAKEKAYKKDHKCVDDVLLQISFDKNDDAIIKKTFGKFILGYAVLEDDRTICKNATVKVNLNDDAFINKSDFSKTISEKAYGVNHIQKSPNDEYDEHSAGKCSYVKDGNSKVALCSESKIYQGNRIYDAIQSKINDSKLASQLNWEKKPKKLPKVQLSSFEIIVIDGLECQEFCR